MVNMENPTFKKMYYRTKIDKKTLKALHVKNEFQAWIRCLGHIGMVAGAGFSFVFFVDRGNFLVAGISLIVYGITFSFLSWVGASHELQHNSVFNNKIANEFWLYLFCLLSWANPVYFRRTHSTHHMHTLDSFLDEEVKTTLCRKMFNIIMTSTIDISRFFRGLRIHLLNARGIVPSKTNICSFPIQGPNSMRDLILFARILLISQFTLFLFFLFIGFWEGILLITFGAFICNGFASLLATAQHCGMQNDSLDYRESTRTILLNPLLCFLYWNMNYHVEHHMYPGVPCYNLPRLHKVISSDIRKPEVGLCAVLKIIYENNRRQDAGDCALR